MATNTNDIEYGLLANPVRIGVEFLGVFNSSSSKYNCCFNRIGSRNHYSTMSMILLPTIEMETAIVEHVILHNVVNDDLINVILKMAISKSIITINIYTKKKQR